MNTLLDMKAIVIGTAIFVVGCVLLGGFSTLMGEDEASRRMVWGVIQICGVFLPIASGFAAAYFARARPILQGVFSGAVTALPSVAIGATFVSNYPVWLAILNIGLFAFLASFGAIFGSHFRAGRSHN